jgi:branched-chain amino acid transport system substrate-binding protein
MKRIFAGAIACALALSATSALAQGKPPLKLGGILDMSGLYADITGAGSETAAKMAVEDFGGEVLGRKIEIIAATISIKPTLPPTSRATCSTTRASR